MEFLYSLRNVRRRFGDRLVLDIDALDIEPGAIYALLGANGAGKSTLMRILSFLDRPSEGELFFRGKKVEPGQEARHRKGVVWVPQHPVMFTGSLLYNIEYPMALKGVPAAERKRRAMELLEIVNLASLRNAPAHRLSGGEVQRASIARALAADAAVIHFDEPTANVDQRSLGDFIALARAIRETRGLSLLVATHNADMAAELCHKQIFLAEGRPVRQRLLPGGGVVWPARMAGLPGGSGVMVSRKALEPFSVNGSLPESGHLRGLAEIAAGVTLRLELGPGNSIDVLLENPACREQIRGMTLGDILPVAPENDTSPGANQF